MGRKKKQDVIVYSGVSARDGVLRMALRPVLDNEDRSGPKFPCRAVFDVRSHYQNSGDWISSCRGVDGGPCYSRSGHVEFKHEGEAIAWLLDGGRP